MTITPTSLLNTCLQRTTAGKQGDEPEDNEEDAGLAVNYLEDFIDLGTTQEVVPTATTSAAGPDPSTAPLKRVPWLSALKGIRSPLLRLHQGALCGRSVLAGFVVGNAQALSWAVVHV